MRDVVFSIMYFRVRRKFVGESLKSEMSQLKLKLMKSFSVTLRKFRIRIRSCHGK